MCEDVMNLGAFVGVLIGCKPHQAVIIEVDSKRIHACNKNIKPQVKLSFVDKVRPGNIPMKSKVGQHSTLLISVSFTSVL